MRRRLFLGLKIFVSVGLIAYVFLVVLGAEGLKKFVQAIGSANKVTLVPPFLIMFVVYCIGSTRWWLLLRLQGIDIGLLRAVRFNFIGLFFNFCMPGVTGGDVARAYYIMRETPRKARAVATIFVDRILGLIGITLVSGTAISLRLPFLVKQNPEYKKLAVTLYLIIGIVIMFGCVFFSRRLRRLFPSEFLARMAGRLPFQGAVRKVIHVIREMDAAFFLYRSHTPAMLLMVAMSCLIHVLLTVTVHGYGEALDVEGVSLVNYYTFVPVIMLITAAPISIAGWGVGEALFVKVFGQMGVEPYRSAAVSILFRLTGLIWSWPGLVFYLLVEGREKPEKIQKAVEKEEQELEEMGEELDRTGELKDDL